MTAPYVPAVDPFQPFTGASYIDPTTGQPVQGATSAPAGVPYYQSAPLVQNPNTGATFSATGTEENPFAGFTDAVGGGFGYSGPVNPASTDLSDPANPARGVLMDAASTDPSRVARALNSGNPDAVNAAMQSLFEQQDQGNATGSHRAGDLTNSSTAGAFNQDWLNSLNPDVRAQVTAGATKAGLDPTALGQIGGSRNVAGTPEQTAAYNAAIAADSIAPHGSTVDQDPFGRFDSPTSPTHGVITPQYENALGDAAQAKLLDATQPGAVPPSAGASATTGAPSTASAPAPASSAQVLVSPHPGSPTVDGQSAPNTIPTTTAAVPPVVGMTATDPFAPYLDPLQTGATVAQQLKAPTFTSAAGY